MINKLYLSKSSKVHDLDFWTKFVNFLLLIPLSAFFAGPTILIIIIALTLLLVKLSRLSFRQFMNSIKQSIFLISMAVGISVFGFSNTPVELRLLQWLEFTSRFFVIISLGVLYGKVTNPIEIPRGFLRARIPHKYGITLMVAIRMIPEVEEKLSNVLDAQRTRGVNFELRGSGLLKFFRQIFALLIPMIYLTLEASVDLSDTVLTRGYNPEGYITVPPAKFGSFDILIYLTALTFLFVAILY